MLWVVGLAVVAGGVIALVAFLRDDGTEVVAEDTTTTIPLPTTASTEPFQVPAGCDVERVPEETAERPTFTEPPAMTIDPAKSYTATIETSCGQIVVALDAANAPVATNNFVFLAREGFYDGTTWHRVVGGFVIQGGDPEGTGTGGPGYEVVGETPSDGYPVGAVAAAKSNEAAAGSFGSQFFVVTGENVLENNFARFGTVTEGLDVAQAIESFEDPTLPESPRQPLYIFSVSITES